MKERICIVGLSHLGLSYLSFFSEKNKIIALDKSPSLINNLKNNFFPLYIENEKEVITSLKKNQRNITYSTNFKDILECKIVILAQDITIDKYFKKNFKDFNFYAKKINANIQINSFLVVLSQVNIGSMKKYFDNLHINKKIVLSYSPNVLTIGESLKSIKSQKLILLGIFNKQQLPINKLILFFKNNFKKIQISDISVAELAKEATQIKLAMDVTFNNIIHNISFKYDIDYNSLTNYLKNDKRFSKEGYWLPSFGFSGGHIERSIEYFKSLKIKSNAQLIGEIESFNENRINSIFDRIKNFKSLMIWGICYKKNSSSTFRSYFERLVFKLNENITKVYYFDNSTVFNFNKKLNKSLIIRVKNIFERQSDYKMIVVLNDISELINCEEVLKIKNKIFYVFCNISNKKFIENIKINNKYHSFLC